MHRSYQLISVIKSLTKHDLTADLDACRGKSVKIRQHPACVFIVHHFTTQLGVCGVYRHVDGRDVHFNYAVNVAVGHVGERNVVSVEKGQPRVVVLEIEGVAHALW
jgi:hypothetical protein